MYSILIDVYNFIKNPIVLMFLFLFGFIQMVVILAALNSSSNLNAITEAGNPKVPGKGSELDWRFKTAIKVESQSQTNKSFDSTSDSNFFVPEIIQYGSEDYQYPLLVDMPDLVKKIKNGENVTVQQINNLNFSFLISNKKICTSNSSIDLLILIKTAPKNYVARDTIRATWGKLNCWGGRTVRRAFLLGRLLQNESMLARHIEMEYRVYGDIIQSDFVDDYYNNTYKFMVGVEWATTNCRNSRFIMFVDDDYFVQPRAVVAYLESISESLVYKLVSGYVWRMAVPQRNRQTKWFVSKEDYPWPFYPPYCSAGNFFLSMPVAIDISIAMKYTRFLRFDDVFLGIILHKLLIVPMHLSNVFSFNPITAASPNYRQAISSHGYGSSKLIMETWIDLNCTHFCFEPLT